VSGPLFLAVGRKRKGCEEEVWPLSYGEGTRGVGTEAHLGGPSLFLGQEAQVGVS